jgi:hypothetical protein
LLANAAAILVIMVFIPKKDFDQLRFANIIETTAVVYNSIAILLTAFTTIPLLIGNNTLI